MEDIAPQLIQSVAEKFQQLYDRDSKTQMLLAKVHHKTATYAEAQEYALAVSQLIGKAFREYVSSDVLPDGKLYYNIANRLIPESLDKNYRLVSRYAEDVQTVLNQNAKIGLRPQTADRDQDRINGLVDLASNADRYDDVADQLLTAFENYSQHIVDETIRKNADFHYRSGLTPKIIRKAEAKCCKWCRGLAGVHDYPAVDPDVYRRHENCRCTVLYDPADGKRKKQNVHTKRWTDDKENAILEERKNIGISSLISNFAKHPKRLASYTPERIVDELRKEGLEIKPLMQGSLRGVSFEDGGGFKANFEDGGLFQYHPEKKSHHEGAYYKISTGKGGTHRYDLKGNEI